MEYMEISSRENFVSLLPHHTTFPFCFFSSFGTKKLNRFCKTVWEKNQNGNSQLIIICEGSQKKCDDHVEAGGMMQYAFCFRREPFCSTKTLKLFDLKDICSTSRNCANSRDALDILLVMLYYSIFMI